MAFPHSAAFLVWIFICLYFWQSFCVYVWVFVRKFPLESFFLVYFSYRVFIYMILPSCLWNNGSFILQSQMFACLDTHVIADVSCKWDSQSYSAWFATTLLMKYGIFFSSSSFSHCGLLLTWKYNICHIVKLYVIPLWLIAVSLNPKFSACSNLMLLWWAGKASSW